MSSLGPVVGAGGCLADDVGNAGSLPFADGKLLQGDGGGVGLAAGVQPVVPGVSARLQDCGESFDGVLFVKPSRVGVSAKEVRSRESAACPGGLRRPARALRGSRAALLRQEIALL